MSDSDLVRYTQKQLLYNKYANYYALGREEPAVIHSMITRTIELGEISCILFDEQSDDTHAITSDDLEDIFERGNKPLSRLIAKQIKGFRHILKTRSVHIIGLMEPTVNVRYTLVWKRDALPIMNVNTLKRKRMNIYDDVD